MTPVIALLSATLLVAIAFATVLMRSKRVARWSQMSLSRGLAHPWLALCVGALLCTYASLTIYAKRVWEIDSSPMYFVLGPIGGVSCAILYCAWVTARMFSSERARSRSWTLVLCVLLAWSV